METSSALIKFTKEEINQLIKALVLRIDVAYIIGQDPEKESYSKLKSDLENIVKGLVEKEQQVNNR